MNISLVDVVGLHVLPVIHELFHTVSCLRLEERNRSTYSRFIFIKLLPSYNLKVLLHMKVFVLKVFLNGRAALGAVKFTYGEDEFQWMEASKAIC